MKLRYWISAVMIVLVIGLLAFWASGPALATDACASIEKVEADVAKWLPVTTVVRLNSAESQIFLKAYNSTPPASFLKADYIAVIDRPDSPVVVLVTLIDGCVSYKLYMRRDYFNSILGVKS